MTETTITVRDLADEMAEKHDITVQAAREGVDTYVGQLVEIDGEEATIAESREVRNGSGRVVGQEITLTADAAEAIRASFAAYYA